MFLCNVKLYICLIIICFYHCKKWILSASSFCQHLLQKVLDASQWNMKFIEITQQQWYGLWGFQRFTREIKSGFAAF